MEATLNLDVIVSKVRPWSYEVKAYIRVLHDIR